jgi:hypothetical protein
LRRAAGVLFKTAVTGGSLYETLAGPSDRDHLHRRTGKLEERVTTLDV